MQCDLGIRVVYQRPVHIRHDTFHHSDNRVVLCSLRVQLGTSGVSNVPNDCTIFSNFDITVDPVWQLQQYFQLAYDFLFLS